jgi:hypothetical protein
MLVFFFCWGVGGAKPDYFLFQLQEKEDQKRWMFMNYHPQAFHPLFKLRTILSSEISMTSTLSEI